MSKGCQIRPIWNPYGMRMECVWAGKRSAADPGSGRRPAGPAADAAPRGGRRRRRSGRAATRRWRDRAPASRPATAPRTAWPIRVRRPSGSSRFSPPRRRCVVDQRRHQRRLHPAADVHPGRRAFGEADAEEGLEPAAQRRIVGDDSSSNSATITRSRPKSVEVALDRRGVAAAGLVVEHRRPAGGAARLAGGEGVREGQGLAALGPEVGVLRHDLGGGLAQQDDDAGVRREGLDARRRRRLLQVARRDVGDVREIRRAGGRTRRDRPPRRGRCRSGCASSPGPAIFCTSSGAVK